MLESGALPALREIYLQKAKLGVEGTKAICAALGTGKVRAHACPPPIKLDCVIETQITRSHASPHGPAW